MKKSKAITNAIAGLAELLGWEAFDGEGVAEALSAALEDDAELAAEYTLISWQGALKDGTLVDFICSDDGKNGGFVLTKDKKTEPKRWLGALTATAEGKVTITDDNTKEAVSFTLVKATKDGAIAIDVEGYGKGAIVPMSAADWKRVAEAEKLAELYETAINWVGTFEDESLVVYMDTPDGSTGALVIGPKKGETKMWTGKVAKDGDKVTITDDDTKEAITITVTKTEEDGTLILESDDHGKGVLIQMTVGDWAALNEAVEAAKAK